MWSSARFGDIVELVRRPVDVEPDGIYPELGIRSFGRGTFHKPAVSGDQITRDLYRICHGDLLLNLTFAWEGAVAIAEPADDGRYASHRFYSFRGNSDQVLLPFLRAYFTTAAGLRRLQAISPGGAGRNRVLSLRKLLEEVVPLPPLPDQHRIVGRLDAASAGVSRAKLLIHEIDEDLLQAARNIIWRAGDRSEAWVPCGDFLCQRPLDVRVEAEVNYHFAGVYSFGRGVFQSQVKAGSTFSYPSLTRIHTDDFIYPKLMAWEGALGVVPTNCDGLVVSPEFPVFEIDTQIVKPAVVDTFFRDPRTLPMLRSASSGTNMRRRRIQPKRFLELKMPIPNQEEQTLITTLLQRRQSVVDYHRDSLDALTALLPAMLDESFGRAD